MSVLIWVRTVCKGYKQMTKVVAGVEGVKDKILWVNTFGNITYLLFFLKAFEALQ